MTVSQWQLNLKRKKYPIKNKIEIENGLYKVEVVQYYNVDKDEYIGDSETDILLNFMKVSAIEPIANKIFWCTYY